MFCATICLHISSTVHTDIQEGTLLASRYEVQEFLGEGSFGIVAKCVDTLTNTELAIKITKDDPCVTKRALEEVSHKLFIDIHVKIFRGYTHNLP